MKLVTILSLFVCCSCLLAGCASDPKTNSQPVANADTPSTCTVSEASIGSNMTHRKCAHAKTADATTDDN